MTEVGKESTTLINLVDQLEEKLTKYGLIKPQRSDRVHIIKVDDLEGLVSLARLVRITRGFYLDGCTPRIYFLEAEINGKYGYIIAEPTISGTQVINDRECTFISDYNIDIFINTEGYDGLSLHYNSKGELCNIGVSQIPDEIKVKILHNDNLENWGIILPEKFVMKIN